MKKHLVFLLIIALLAIGCKKGESPTNPTPDPTGQQRGIPWPSLANSPWPMNHGNPQSTGRSAYRGPSLGVLDWQFDTVYSEAGVVLKSDTVASISGIAPGGSSYLYFVGPNASLEQRIATGASSVTPLLASDGTVYLGGYDGKLRAYSGSGVLKWAFDAGSSIALQGMNIGLDGTVYFVTTASILCAVSPSGQLAWQLQDLRFNNGWHCVLSFSPDGQTLYVPGMAGPLLLAVNITTHAVAWTFGLADRDALAPVVDNEGHIYMLGPGDTVHSSVPSLYCINSDGTLRWVFAHGNTFDIVNAADPTIDVYGNIAFAMDTLYSVDYSGNLRWKVKLHDWADSPLVSDRDGTLYVTENVASRAAGTVAFSFTGTELWHFSYSPSYANDNSPAISSDGRLFIVDTKGRNLYALR